MSAFELNKIIGAVLAALVFVMGLSVLSEIIFDEKELYEPAYAIAIEEADTAAEEEAVQQVPLGTLLAAADAGKGESATRVCSACHSFEEGGPNGIGPHMWGIVGRPMAHESGFNYSSALVAHAEEAPVWTYEELDGFLENPQGWVPGTIMGYAGIKDPAQRADVIAYLKSVSPDAPPYPEAPAEEVDVASAAPDQMADAVVENETVQEELAAEAAGVPAMPPFLSMVAAADPGLGETSAAVCLACHSVEEGAPHKLGPNLHNVFGSIAEKAAFDYSTAMHRYAETHKDWNVDTLNEYLRAPMEVVQGTRMAYAGVKDDETRAAIIAWLHSLSPDAGPLVPPAPVETVATEPAAEADSGAAPAPASDAEAPAATTDDASSAPAAPAAAPASDEAAPASETEETSAPAATEQDTAAPAAPAEAAAAPAAAPASAAEATDTAAADASGDSHVEIKPAQPGQVEIVR